MQGEALVARDPQVRIEVRLSHRLCEAQADHAGEGGAQEQIQPYHFLALVQQLSDPFCGALISWRSNSVLVINLNVYLICIPKS